MPITAELAYGNVNEMQTSFMQTSNKVLFTGSWDELQHRPHSGPNEVSEIIKGSNLYIQ